ncbi:MAG: amidohydrolase family protein [Candidatus Asgardarchaeia archaeon]
MGSILIKNAVILTMDEKRRIIRDGAVAVDGDKIVAVGKTEKIEKEYKGADRVFDVNGNIVMPGLVNTHSHLFQELGKNLGTDVDLLGWFKAAWAPLVEGLTAEDYYNAVKLAALEAIKTGTTTVLGYEHALNAHPDAADYVVKALTESKIRAILGYGYQDTGEEIGAPKVALRDTDSIIKELERVLKTYHRTIVGDMLRIWLAPGTMNWMSDTLIEETKRLSNEFNTGITVHMDETRAEYEYSKKTRGVSEIGYAYKIGLLGPRTLAVHTVWADDDGIEMLAKTNTKVSHNPVSNMYLASGVAPIPKMLKKGITVGLATDGPTSNNNHDMFDVIRITPLLHKVANLSPLALSAEQTLEMATIMGARAILMDDLIGSIEVGKKADLIILNLRHPNVVPVTYHPAVVVYSASSENVDTVIINGEVLMENRKILHMDEEEVMTAAQKSIERILERSGKKLETHWPYE